MADSLGGLANAFRIVEEAALLRVIVVHPLQNFTQGRLPVTGFAHLKIKHYAE